MSNPDKKRQTGCAIAFGLDIFGDRWTLLVIREMMLYGKQTYGEFLAIDENISTNILADRLKHLESEGIIDRTQDPGNRRSFTYTLTPKGRDLAPVLMEIIRWSGKHDRRPVARKRAVNELKRNPAGFEAVLRSKIGTTGRSRQGR